MVQYLHQLLITLKVVSIQSRHHHWDIDSIDFIIEWLLFFFPISEQESILAPLWILILIRITYAVYYWVYHTTCCESMSSARSSLKASRMKTESKAKQRKKKWKCSQVSLAALDTWLLSSMCLKMNVARSISLHMRECNAVVMLPTSNDNFVGPQKGMHFWSIICLS